MKKVATVSVPTMINKSAKIDLLFVKRIEKIIASPTIKKWEARL